MTKMAAEHMLKLLKVLKLWFQFCFFITRTQVKVVKEINV